jgi:hypothetical protein
MVLSESLEVWVQAAKLCHIFYYANENWKKPAPHSHMVSPLHHMCVTLNPLLVITLVHCQSKYKVVRNVWVKLVVIEYLTVEKIPPIDIHCQMQAVYGGKCVDVSTVNGGYGSLGKKWGELLVLGERKRPFF